MFESLNSEKRFDENITSHFLLEVGNFSDFWFFLGFAPRGGRGGSRGGPGGRGGPRGGRGGPGGGMYLNYTDIGPLGPKNTKI